MKSLLIGFVMVLFSQLALFAQKHPIQKHIHTKNQYLNAYADKDSSLAYIINLWFEQRKIAKQKICAFPISFGLFIISGAIRTNSKQESSKLASYGVVFGGVSSIFSIPISLKGVKQLRTYSKKHLNENIDLILNHNQKGNQILEKLLRDKMISEN